MIEKVHLVFPYKHDIIFNTIVDSIYTVIMFRCDAQLS